MTIVVGYGPEARGHGELELARMFAHSAQLPLVVCCAIPQRWQTVGPGRQVDRDYETYLRSLAAEAMSGAEARIGALDVPVTYEVVTSRSSPAGLLESVQQHDASLLVVGSSTHGAWGHIALGSVSDRLLHSSPVPVALTPRGTHFRVGSAVERVTVAVDGTASSQDVLNRAASVAHDLHAQLRIVTFAVRTPTMYPPEVDLHAEDKVVAEWGSQARQIVESAVAGLDVGLAGDPQLHVAEARSWSQALDEPGWDSGDVLVIGSSSSQSVLSRVFLGSTATRIIRHSPVPVVVVP